MKMEMKKVLLMLVAARLSVVVVIGTAQFVLATNRGTRTTTEHSSGAGLCSAGAANHS